LHNIDQGYFGHDGLFVVAEEDGEIIGLAGARQSSDSADVLELIRLAVSPEKSDNTTGGAIKDRMLAIIKNHAYQMDFKTIKVKDDLAALVS
jgi:N-acetylglutamate synthase-like GNAT family acetyltransferase